jgi:hypothetical protein
MTPTLPSRLYKYQPYNVQTLDNLKEQILWFSKPVQFNDPFDCRVVPSEIGPLGEKDWQGLFEQVRAAAAEARQRLPASHPDETFRKIVKAGIRKSFDENIDCFQQHGVACFSAQVDNILLWSHYADGHRGFCLEFDTTYAPFRSARPVQYADAFPPLNAREVVEVFSKRNPEPQMKFFFTKSRCWEYEQEWRILQPRGGTAVPFDSAALTGIYLGCEMPEVHQEVIVRLLAGFPAHVYEMKSAATKFKVEAELMK